MSLRTFCRRGAVDRTLLAIIASGVVLITLIVVLFNNRPGVQPPAKPKKGDPEIAQQPKVVAKPLVLYVAASNKNVIEAIRADYEKEFQIPLEIQFGPSQTLLAQLAVTKTGDLYLPADDSYLKTARERELIDDVFPLAKMNGILAVAKGNPLQIKTWEDLLRPEVRLAQANPEAAAIGKLTKEALEPFGLWEKLHAHTTVYKTNVTEVANDIKAKAVDAGIIYDAVLHDYDTLEGVSLPVFSQIQANVALAVLKSSPNAEQARHFARYVAASDRGLLRYKERGFQPVKGEPFADAPQK